MIINLTPHEVNLINDDQSFNWPKCDNPPRLTEVQKHDGFAESFVIMKKSFGECENLPDQKEGDFLIVSQLVASAFPKRSDLIIPNDMIRDESGRIIGCKSFARI